MHLDEGQSSLLVKTASKTAFLEKIDKMAIIVEAVIELIGYDCGQCALINISIINHELTRQLLYSPIAGYLIQQF